MKKNNNLGAWTVSNSDVHREQTIKYSRCSKIASTSCLQIGLYTLTAQTQIRLLLPCLLFWKVFPWFQSWSPLKKTSKVFKILKHLLYSVCPYKIMHIYCVEYSKCGLLYSQVVSWLDVGISRVWPACYVYLVPCITAPIFLSFPGTSSLSVHLEEQKLKYINKVPD